MKKLSVILACTLVMMAGCKAKDNPIKLNQVGFYPQAEKTASIEDDARTNEAALLTMDGKVVWEGKAVREAVSPWSGKTRHIIDFSEVTEPGEYLLRVGESVRKVRSRSERTNMCYVCYVVTFCRIKKENSIARAVEFPYFYSALAEGS